MASTSPTLKLRISRLDNWALRAITGGAMIFAAIGIWALVARVVYLLTSRDIQVAGMALGNASVPEFTLKAPAIVTAQYDSVTITVSHLSDSARGLLVAESIASGLLAVGLCVIVAWLGMRILYGTPFVRSGKWAIASAALLLAASGMLTNILGAVARAEVVQNLDPTIITAGGDATGSYEGFIGLMLSVPVEPLAWACALAVVAASFQIGERLQRDTRGLV